ncbi:MAG: hypothetical protein IKO72_00595 [Kiritimatiellae bacterium]|nr:hypothetical protein [Kiritimatiellia bacterium]
MPVKWTKPKKAADSKRTTASAPKPEKPKADKPKGGKPKGDDKPKAKKEAK